MKTLDFSLYEKLKIRPVNVNDINTIEWIDPNSISIGDLRPGYICRTAERHSNIRLYLDPEQLVNIYGKDGYPYDCGAFVKPVDNDPYIKVSCVLLKYFCGSWPVEPISTEFSVSDVWKTSFDVSVIKTKDDVIDFFNKYNLSEIWK